MLKNRFVLIDAFALIHRAYHALPPLTRNGQQVNAVYGFVSALLAAIKELQPEYLAACFDTPKPTKRHEEYKEYKAHREKVADELIDQVPLVMELLLTMEIPVLAKDGYEGEDIIATVIHQLTTNNKQQTTKEQSCKLSVVGCKLEFIIVTGDMDTLQLIDESTKVYSMARGATQAVMYDEKKVEERYGLKPSQFVDFKALKGDASDNIPGVRGIGEKTAANLIQKFGSLEHLYDVIASDGEAIYGSPRPEGARDDIKKLSEKAKISQKILTLLIENKEQAFLSQKLSKIVDDAPVKFNLEDAKVHHYDKEKVIDLFERYGFRSLIPRLHESHRVDNNQQKLF